MRLPRTSHGTWTGQARTHQDRRSERFQRNPDKEGCEGILMLDRVLPKVCIGLANVAACLSDLTRKQAPNRVAWKQQHQIAFDKHKECLQEELVLVCTHHTKEFWLLMNASNRGVGAVCCQKKSDGKDHRVANYSRKLPGGISSIP